MAFSAAIPTFVVTLREGVEAALVVGIVLAYLNKAGRSHLNSWVYGGIGAGIGASMLVGLVLLGLLSGLDASDQAFARVLKPLLEGVFSLVAIAFLSWMLIWMTRQARLMKRQVEGAIADTLEEAENPGWGVFSLILIAVLREGFETVVFISAQFQEGTMAVGGAIAGLIGAVFMGLLIFRLGVKINLRLFFQGLGVLLLLIVSGLVITSLRHFDAAAAALAQISPQWAGFCPSTTGSCFLGPELWDASAFLPDRQFPGILLKAFFGYTQHLYLIEALGYLIFLGIVGGFYLQSITGISLPSSKPQE